MRRFGTPSEADLEQLRAAPLTYEHIGSTLVAAEPKGARRVCARKRIGQGPRAFAAARIALRTWAPQRSLGMTITPGDVSPDLGRTVVLSLGVGPARLRIPNRVVAVIDEGRRYGYAYGTLPGHPECGEELFLVEHTAADEVVLTICADAEPAGLLRLVRPLVDAVQGVAIRRYLAAVRDAAPGIDAS